MAAAARSDGPSYYDPRMRLGLPGHGAGRPSGRTPKIRETKTNFFISKYSLECVYHYIWET